MAWPRFDVDATRKKFDKPIAPEKQNSFFVAKLRLRVKMAEANSLSFPSPFLKAAKSYLKITTTKTTTFAFFFKGPPKSVFVFFLFV